VALVAQRQDQKAGGGRVQGGAQRRGGAPAQPHSRRSGRNPKARLGAALWAPDMKGACCASPTIKRRRPRTVFSNLTCLLDPLALAARHTGVFGAGI